MILVAQDEDGLRQAAAELMEEIFEAPQRERNEKLAESCADPEIILRASLPKRSLSPGYYLWLEFLVTAIEMPREAGVIFRESDLSMEEVIGLGILREAREEFRKKHPSCKGCGAPLQNEWDKACNNCQRAAAASARGN